MADSDDDIEIKHESVTNYWVESRDDCPVSFTTLPYVVWEDTNRVAEKEMYLRGTSDSGMSVYVRVFSWKLKLERDTKLVLYLETDKNWIKLLKPRKSYEDTIRGILTVVHILNYALVKPEASEKAAWDYVKELFSSWEVEPNKDDLTPHITVILHILFSIPRLASSRAVHTMGIGLSRGQSTSTEVISQSRRKRMRDSENNNIEYEMERVNKRSMSEGGSESDDEKDSEKDADVDEVAELSEAVCCICDNGGEVTGCDGPCMRSFHVHKDAPGADDVSCETLGFQKSAVQRMDKFYCPNCQAKEHQCYACGELGPSDETVNSTQKVYVCDAAMCGRFYHPRCVAELILRDKNESEKSSLADSIKDGKGFVCPMHKCWKCGKGEVKEERNLQFGICRRCPRVWHRKCFPSYILFSEQINNDLQSNDMVARAWDGLLQDRILIYCKRHSIIPSLGTPERSHVKFPAGYMSASKTASEKKASHLGGENVKLNRVNSLKRMDYESSRLMFEKAPKTDRAQANTAVAVESAQKMDYSKLKQPATIAISRKLESSAKHDDKSHVTANSGKNKVKLDVISTIKKVDRFGNSSSEPPLNKPNIVSKEVRTTVDNIIRKAKEKVSLQSVINKHEAPINYRNSSDKNIGKMYSSARIQSIIKGMRKALETLENGGTLEEAKMQCSAEHIRILDRCKNDLRIYLSPLLHGARYTSYGRHFTKIEKLEQIAERLHWYVNDGDMIVDFCCGANDFSLLMKEKLEKEGKACHYKNFDAIQAKNDFCFSKRDWFTVQKDELLDGERLIMGLNPPFGVKAALANQFIDHALKFRPKLLVLIVPKETKRLDQKPVKYDLIWDDPDLLEGKSFYLPGSVDICDNPMSDWNTVAPPLYMWSRTDWTAKHKHAAFQAGHIKSQTSTRYTKQELPYLPLTEKQVKVSNDVSKIDDTCTVNEGNVDLYKNSSRIGGWIED